MLESLKHKATKEDYKGGMQYMVQRHEPIMDRVQIGLNKDQNMLRLRHKCLGMHTYTLSHKQGNKCTTLKGTQRVNEVGT